jgi:hypothetical protein
MKRTEEWDWPREPTRRRRRTVDADRTVSGMPVAARPEFEFTRLGDFKRPLGWNSPGVKMAIRIYWAVTITVVKMVIAVPLTAMAIAAAWMIWTLVTL